MRRTSRSPVSHDLALNRRVGLVIIRRIQRTSYIPWIKTYTLAGSLVKERSSTFCVLARYSADAHAKSSRRRPPSRNAGSVRPAFFFRPPPFFSPVLVSSSLLLLFVRFVFTNSVVSLTIINRTIEPLNVAGQGSPR